MEFTPIRINTIKPLREINFNLFIYFQDQYLLYGSKGSVYDEEKHKKLKKQKIAKFYIPVSDEKEYQKYLDMLLNDSLNSSTTPVEEKVALVQDVSMSAIENLQKDPASEKSFRATRKAAANIKQLITENPSALKDMFTKQADNEHDIMIKHSLNVCLLATKLAEAMRLDEEVVSEITIAALMHDVGVVQLPGNAVELFKRPKNSLSHEEKKIYKDHIDITNKMISEKPYISPKVIELITYHEEVLSGEGPFKLKKLPPAVECLSLVNCYDKKILTSGHSPKESLKEMMVDELGNYQLELLNLFKKVLQKEGILND